MKFAYKAVNISGKETEGVIEAVDQSSALQHLHERSLYPTHLREIQQSSGWNVSIGSQAIPKKVLGLFCQQFATVIKAGVPTAQALTILTEQTEHKKLKEILTEVGASIQKGLTLSQAMSLYKKNFPDIMLSMIAAGEVSGTLERSLDRLAIQFDRVNKLHEKVRSAITYPIVVGGLCADCGDRPRRFHHSAVCVYLPDGGCPASAPDDVSHQLKRVYTQLLGAYHKLHIAACRAVAHL